MFALLLARAVRLRYRFFLRRCDPVQWVALQDKRNQYLLIWFVVSIVFGIGIHSCWFEARQYRLLRVLCMDCVHWLDRVIGAFSMIRIAGRSCDALVLSSDDVVLIRRYDRVQWTLPQIRWHSRLLGCLICFLHFEGWVFRVVDYRHNNVPQVQSI